MKQVFICISMLSLLIAACQKDKPVPRSTSPLGFEIKVRVGDKAYHPDSIYYINQCRVKITNAWIYLSDLSLLSQGIVTPIPARYILLSLAQPIAITGLFEAPEQGKLQFSVGIDSLTNHSDPTVHPAGHPLSLQNEPMHWGWNTGYIFIKMEGVFDTLLQATTIPQDIWYYHIGLNEHFIADMQIPYRLKNNCLSMGMNLEGMFRQVNLVEENATMSIFNEALAIKIRENFRHHVFEALEE